MRRLPRGRGPIVAVLAGAAVVAALLLQASGRPPGTATATGSDTAAPSVTASSSPALPSPGPSASAASESPAPSSASPGLPAVAIVPVVGYRSLATGINRAGLLAALAGDAGPYRAVEVLAGTGPAILAAAGVPGDAVVAGSRLFEAPDLASLAADLRANPRRLGLVPAASVGPELRAIDWDGHSLFGVQRERSLATWPLLIEWPAGLAAPAAFDPEATWTLVAGGDVNLDGAVGTAARQRGVDYPWDGGTASITSRWCCTDYGFEMAVAKRTGHRGAVRDLLARADLAIVNFENPAPDDFTFHPGGYVFTADPALIEGLANAGIDWVSLANNHIRDAGDAGVLETLANLDRWGIAHGGAGATRAAARAPSLLAAAGVSVAILAYDAVRPAYHATATTPGSMGLSEAALRRDIAAARAQGAELVIVFPHWGLEYKDRPSGAQERLGRAAIDAGADLVLGNHSHWVGALEVYAGRPIVYSLADFVFNIPRSERTREGILVEATFTGARLAQLRLHPFFIVGGVQPNLLDPAGGADDVMGWLFEASGDRLPW